MMARRHSRVNIIRESLQIAPAQNEKAKMTRKHKEEYGKVWADEILSVFQMCYEAKIPKLNCKQG